MAARERIRIAGQPISEHEFASYFWEVFDRLEQAMVSSAGRLTDSPTHRLTDRLELAMVSSAGRLTDSPTWSVAQGDSPTLQPVGVRAR